MSYTFETKRTKSFVTNTNAVNHISSSESIIGSLGGDLEQCSDGMVVSNVDSSLATIVQFCFATHRHLVLDPDAVWLTIERGLASHIKENAETLRSKFVKFDGKKNIEIRRDEFVRGGKNDWESCFDEFSEKIGQEIGDQKDIIVGNFSTTGTLQKVSSEIVLMDAMSQYFTYSVKTLCGIPSITLDGEVKDWEIIREKFSTFKEYGMEWWVNELTPVLDKIIESSKGNVDLDFWENFYNESGGSGGPHITGHITKFYPYLVTYDQKNYVNKFNNKVGFSSDRFPKGNSGVPFVWDYLGVKYPMEFIGGIIGAVEDNGRIRCSFGWAVRDSSIPITSYPIEKLTKDLKIYFRKKVGLLKKAVVGSNSQRLCELEILWEDGLKKYKYYEINELYVKDPCITTESVTEEKAKENE
jgi:hypothetical protein